MAISTYGRHLRPHAGPVSMTLLALFVLLLAPPCAHAQNIFSMLGSNVETPTPVVVLDFTNKSDYATGMLGRTMAESMTVEMLNTRLFEVVNRKDVDDLLQELNLAAPFSYQAQAMVADRLKCPYAVSGEVEQVKIHRTREGAYASVTVKSVMVSKITRLPISGARVVQQGTPKLGFKGNTDVLVHEALNTAAYVSTQQLLDNRISIGTVLSTPRAGEITLKGGTSMGFRKGMEMTTIRRESVTGRIRLVEVNPQHSTAVVLSETNGIATGDKVVPIYEPTITGTTVKEKRSKSGIALATAGALAVLALLVGTDGDTVDALKPGAPTAAAIANAAVSSNPNGAIRISWPMPSDQVVCYVIYRSGGGYTNLPIAVVSRDEREFIDTDTTYPPNKSFQLVTTPETISFLDDESGLGETTALITKVDYAAGSGADEFDRYVTVGRTEVDVACIRPRPMPGESYSYQVLPIIKDLYRDEENSKTHFEFVRGTLSNPSAWVTMVAPPVLLEDLSATQEYFSCATSVNADDYVFQICDSPTFSSSNKLYTIADLSDSDSDGYVRANVRQADLASIFGPIPSTGKQLYWRFGARVESQPKPQPWRQDGYNCAGYVFPYAKTYNLPIPPPTYPAQSIRQRPAGINPGLDIKGGTGRKR